jgi:imidazolonepropionase
MKLLLLNIKELIQVEERPRKWIAGKEMSRLNTISNAFLLISDELISDFGPMDKLNDSDLDNHDVLMEIDCSGKMVFPSFCDPDSHLLYPFSHEDAFADKNTKNRGFKKMFKAESNKYLQLHEMSEDEIYDQAIENLQHVIKKGTGAIEIKSGYGLDPEDEIKMLHVIRELKKSVPLAISSTFLGTHTFPFKYIKTPEKYADILVNTILPQIIKENLADNIDIYVDKRYFSNSTIEYILRSGMRAGLKPKMHSDELGLARLRSKSLSEDIEIIESNNQINGKRIGILAKNHTLPVIMPGASFFHNLSATSAREMIDAGLPIAIASDFDPGEMPSCDMKFMMSLCCIKYGMTPEEVINAATINSAYAMDISDGYGSIARGKAANLFITTNIPSYQFFPYAYNSDLIDMVILGGVIQ